MKICLTLKMFVKQIVICNKAKYFTGHKDNEKYEVLKAIFQ